MFDGVHVSSTARVLIDARALIERGWCQGYEATASPLPTIYLRSDPWLRPPAVSWANPAATHYCMSGAVQRAAALNNVEHYPAMQALKKVTRIKVSIPFWNDRPGRTKEQVLTALDKAITRQLTLDRAIARELKAEPFRPIS